MSQRELRMWALLGATVLCAGILMTAVLAHGAPATQPIDPTVPSPVCLSTSDAVLAWLLANWQTVVLVYLIPCLLAGWRNHERGTGVVGVLTAAVQWLAVTVPKDSPGTLKLPCTMPKAPVQAKGK